LVEPKPFSPVKLICGIIASEERFFKRAEERLVELYGSQDLASQIFEFDFTDYYRREMGDGLIRFWCAASRLAPAAQLADWKVKSCELEARWGKPGARRVNLDPGYLTSLQVILATTKPLPQAVYLRDGIYALVELLYRSGGFKSLPWTYPDYAKAASEGAFEVFRSQYLKLSPEGEA